MKYSKKNCVNRMYVWGLAQLVVRVLPTSIRVPLDRGFKLSWRRKKRAIGTYRNSTYEWDPSEER